jgi:hypothetical protein
MPVRIKIPDHILMPFGCPKWDKNQIQMDSVGLDGTYFVSNTKCAYIDKSKKQPLRMGDFKKFFPDDESSFPTIEDPLQAFGFAFRVIEQNCELGTEHERKFLSLYRDYIIEEYVHEFRASRGWLNVDQADYKENRDRIFAALMPFPQAHLYARDPFGSDFYGFAPERMFKVDFAFWTGSRLVGVEIDGGSHIGNARHVEKDRLLARAGVHLIHILNTEIDKHEGDVVEKLLPKSVTKPGLLDPEIQVCNPFEFMLPL